MMTPSTGLTPSETHWPQASHLEAVRSGNTDPIAVSKDAFAGQPRPENALAKQQKKPQEVRPQMKREKDKRHYGRHLTRQAYIRTLRHTRN
jgi:hypothetical protein